MENINAIEFIDVQLSISLNEKNLDKIVSLN
jgi:hypothetical protein